jgi:NADPH-dependent 2,4-dienoyl-CoA reductase/sulfur reductase-like enzyme/predicted acylesterase/phospholipase RssA
MARKVDFLLVGGGLASATTAETLRDEGAEGTILILSAEQSLPYHRPPLSTEFLIGDQSKEQLPILSAVYYRDQAIDAVLGACATAVDPENRIVQTDQAGAIQYGQLLIATGASPSRLEVPGSALHGIHYLRTIGDAEAIKTAMATAKRAVVVGGSFIGMELAASLTKKGIHVTIIALEEVLLAKLEAPVISEFFRRYYGERGIEIILGDAVIAFRGSRRVTAVITRSGRTLPCDMVLVGVGVTPQTDFLQGSGIAVDDGIVVDRYLQTSQPNIFAAGDVCNFFDPVFNLRRRIEHWDNAVKQGRLVAKNMLAQRLPYDEVSYFFCDVFDLSFDFFGLAEHTPDRIERGSLKRKSFALFYLNDGVPRALFSLGRPAQETKATEALIRYRVNLHTIEAKLSDPGFSLEQFPSQTVLILQGGGALGAFECGVVKALEEKQIHPDIVAGVSMGAFNGAVIAANPGNATVALEAFWNELGVYTPDVPDESLRRMLSSWQSLVFGSPRFFHPRWLMPILGARNLPLGWTSLYDASPIKALLAKYVDFGRLKSSPVRLLVSAVNVETAELEIFDSYIDDLTPDHILASGSLPPGFPWTTINGKHYWDGAIVSNSPLEQVVARCGVAGKRVFIVDLFSSKSPLPTDLLEVMARRDEIVYSERIRNDVHTRDLVRDFRKLVQEILGHLDPATALRMKQRPPFIQLMGDVAPPTVTRIIRKGAEQEAPSKDYDFSRKSIEQGKREGYDMTRRTLEREQSHPPRKNP